MSTSWSDILQSKSMVQQLSHIESYTLIPYLEAQSYTVLLSLEARPNRSNYKAADNFSAVFTSKFDNYEWLSCSEHRRLKIPGETHINKHHIYLA